MSTRAILSAFLLATLSSAHALAQHHVALQSEGRLLILAADGALEWELPCGEAHGLQALRNGNLMLRRGSTAVVVIERESGSMVWTCDAASVTGGQVSSFQPLPSGNVLLAGSAPGRVVEVDRLGRIQRELQLQTEGSAGQAGIFDLRVLADGNLLVCHGRAGRVAEYGGADGALVWQYDLPASPESLSGAGTGALAALRLPGGNTLIATEPVAGLLEVTPEKEIVWTLAPDKLDDTGLDRITSIQLLESGNYALGNRQAAEGRPLVVELDPQTQTVVWRLTRDAELGGPISSLLVMDGGPKGASLELARRIHRATLTLDTHKDISITLASPNLPEDPVAAASARLANDPTVWGTNQVDFPKMRAGGLDVAFYIVYVGQGSLDEQGFADARAVALSKFETIERMAARYPEHIEIAHSAADVERIAATGKLVACIGIENGYAMGQDLSAIEEFHQRGARYMSLTHNRHSQLGDSNTPENEPLHGGLSDLGRRAIEEMNRVGIMVDISHAGELTTLQAIAHSKAPVIASHSGVDGVRLHGRNLSDAELLALKKNGGVIQCVAFDSYVKDDGGRRQFIMKTRVELGLPARGRADGTPEQRTALRERVRAFDAKTRRANVADFADHIDYAVKLIGIEYVAISSDFDGGGGVDGWNDASETFNVTLELVRRGYSSEEIEMLWSGNTLRVWRAVEAVAEKLAAKEE